VLFAALFVDLELGITVMACTEVVREDFVGLLARNCVLSGCFLCVCGNSTGSCCGHWCHVRDQVGVLVIRYLETDLLTWLETAAISLLLFFFCKKIVTLCVPLSLTITPSLVLTSV
jgi:hypothetical protein